VTDLQTMLTVRGLATIEGLPFAGRIRAGGGTRRRERESEFIRHAEWGGEVWGILLCLPAGGQGHWRTSAATLA
jgi:hypothetical protein